MIATYLFLLASILMLNRKVFLFMVPVFVGISYRFGSVTNLRNFTTDEVLVVVSAIQIVQNIIIRKFDYRMPLLRWHLIYLIGMAFTFLLGMLVFQSYGSFNLVNTVMIYIKERLYTPLVFAAVFTTVKNTDEGLAMLRWAAVVGALISIYAIIQYHWFILPRVGDFGSFWLYSWYDEGQFWKVYSMRRSFGTTGSPGSFGRYLMLIVVLGLVQGIHGLEDRRPWLPGLGIALLAFYCLGTTGSRGSMVALVASVGTIIYLERKSFSRNFIILMIGAMAFIYAVPTIMSERMGTAVDEGAQELNVAARFNMWTIHTNDALNSNPITGFGFMREEDCYDNDMVGIFYEGGFFLLFLFFLWMLSMYQFGMSGVISPHRLSQMSGIIALGCWVAMMGAALSGRTFFGPKISLEYFYILALCTRLIVLEGRQRRQQWLAQQFQSEAVLP